MTKTVSKLVLSVSAITALGLLLRLITLGAGIDLDDAITIYVAGSHGIAELIENTTAFEFGPPLYFMLMSVWEALFGRGAVSLALSSIITGCLLIPLTYMLAGRCPAADSEAGRRQALIACFFAAVSPLAIFFSHEVRAYSLLAVLSTATMIFFLDSIENASKKNLALLFLFSTLTVYTHYAGLYLIALLCLSTLLSRTPSLKVYLAFGLALLAFAPWVPQLLTHLRHGTYWVDRTPLIQAPEVFASNLAATLPLPWIAGFVLVILAVPAALILFTVKLVQGKSPGKIEPPGTAMTMLYLTGLVPVFTLGFLTPFILGYCRYMTPFAVPIWILLAGLVQSKLKNRLVLSGLLAVLAIASAVEIKAIASTDRNGLRAVARDMKDGKYRDCAFLVVPDFDSYTLLYYLQEEQQAQIPQKGYLTFPRAGERKPASHRGYAELWSKDGLIRDTLDRVGALDKSRFPKLAVIQDRGLLESSKMPARSVSKALLDELSRRYGKPGSTVEYHRPGRSFDLYIFDLNRE
ncbi:MAG: glycosyltransferase family 39 protein [Cyanobacteria bacterium HKST-UBA02]|nr:glycosyltransferase family 39 protein [Cyanobacteria bacterium HKST-UBA02]